MPSFEGQRRNYVNQKINPVEPFFSKYAQAKIRGLTDKNLILVAADVDYALEYIEFMFLYSKLFSKQKRMPVLVCAIFNSSRIDESFNRKYVQLCSKMDGKKGIIVVDFFAFYFSNYEVHEDAACILRDLIINYIKSARFALVPKLWQLTECQNLKMSIGESEFIVYVMDYDFIANDNFDLAIRSKYYGSYCLLSCDISGDSQKFEQTLSKSSIERTDPNSNIFNLDLSLSHKVIKAGFSCFSPSPISNYIFYFFNCYAFQFGARTTESPERFLFSHYYGDQLSLIAAVRELRYTFEKNYFKDIAWINLKKSNIVNLDSSKKTPLYLPKGNPLG